MNAWRDTLIGIVCVLMIFVSGTAFSQNHHDSIKKIVILLLTSHKSNWTIEHLSGIENTINQSDADVTIEYLPLENKNEIDQSSWNTISELDADLIITNGTRLGYSALQYKWEKPLILSGCMGIWYLQFNENNDVGVVSYDYSFDVYLSAIKNAFPGAKKIGFGYSPDNVEKFRVIDSIAASMGMKLITYEARDTGEILPGFESVLPSVEVAYCLPWMFSFWGNIDDGICEQSYLKSYKYGVPVTTIHPSALNMGVCFCLLPDYYEIGRLTGELVLERIENGPFEKPVILEPQNYQYVVNESMTSRLGIHYPEEFMNKAAIVGIRPSPEIAEKP